jgi:hypothetical protein
LPFGSRSAEVRASGAAARDRFVDFFETLFSQGVSAMRQICTFACRLISRPRSVDASAAMITETTSSTPMYSAATWPRCPRTIC